MSRQAFKDAAVAQAFTGEDGRQIVHCLGGTIGADWYLSSVLDVIEDAASVRWKRHFFDHELQVETLGRVYCFAVVEPASTPVTTSASLATLLVASRVLSDHLKAVDAALREQAGVMLVGERAVAAIGDLPIGTVTRTKPRDGSVTAAVTDEAALVAWCDTHAPDEVQTVRSVRVSFQRVLLDAAKTGGWVDKTSGEVVDVPGITVTPAASGTPGLMVKPADDAEQVIRAAWQDGRLALTDLLEIAP